MAFDLGRSVVIPFRAESVDHGCDLEIGVLKSEIRDRLSCLPDGTRATTLDLPVPTNTVITGHFLLDKISNIIANNAFWDSPLIYISLLLQTPEKLSPSDGRPVSC